MFLKSINVISLTTKFNNMKYYSKLLVTALFAFASFLASCSSDPCEKVVCQNSGTKTKSTDGKSCACTCAPGYKGDSCQTVDKKYLLTSSKWKAVSVMVAGTDQLKDCDRDDEYSFSTDGKVTITPMGVACSSTETVQTTTYTISEDGKTMTYGYNNPPAPPMTLTLNVTSLTADKLDASGSMMGIPFQLVFAKK